MWALFFSVTYEEIETSYTTNNKRNKTDLKQLILPKKERFADEVPVTDKLNLNDKTVVEFYGNIY